MGQWDVVLSGIMVDNNRQEYQGQCDIDIKGKMAPWNCITL